MYRKLGSFKYLVLLLVVYVTFLATYIKLQVGAEFLLLIEDFLLPIGAFSLGIKFEKRKVFWLLIFIIVGVLARIIGNGDLYEIYTSIIILFGYIIGGYSYRAKSEKKVLFFTITLMNLGLLCVPNVSIPFYTSLVTSKGMLYDMITPLTGISYTVTNWLISGLEFWSYALEIVEKLFVGFFVVKVHNAFAKRLDFSLDLSYFHRRFGMVILEAFMLVLLARALGYNGVLQYSIAIFSFYFFVIGAIEIFAFAKVSKVLRRGFLKRNIHLLWIFALILVSFEVSFIIIVLTIIYSAYIATIGKHNMIRLLSDTIKRIKGV